MVGWEKVARIVEVGSGVAVLITLVVLINEVRDNTSAMKRQGMLESIGLLFYDDIRTAGYAQILKKIQDVDGQSAAVKELMERYGLSDAEAITLSQKSFWFFLSLEADWRSGIDRDDTTRVAAIISSLPDRAIVWRNVRGFMRPEFVASVEARASQSTTLGQ